MGNLVEETLDLFEFTTSTHLYYEAASPHGSHVVINGSFASPHALSHTLAGDGLERGWNSPQGEHVLGVHRAVDCQAHHFKMAPVKITTTQCLKVNGRIRNMGFRPTIHMKIMSSNKYHGGKAEDRVINENKSGPDINE